MKILSQNSTLQFIKTLGESKDPSRIDQLVRFLNGSNTAIQNGAAIALQEYGLSFIGPILASIIKQQRNNIRAATSPKRPVDINVVATYDAKSSPIGTVMVDLGSSTISSLIPLLNSDDKALKDTVKRVFLEFGTVAVEPLIIELKNPDKNIRLNALYILGEIKDIRAAEVVMNALRDEDVDIRNAAASAIKGFNITTVPKERETIREIVKIPCSYCGSLVEITATKCPTCGAPLKT